MARRIALVKSKDEAFKLGLNAESIDPSLKDSAKYDAFVLSEPGVPATKIPKGEVLENVMVLQHRYTNLQGKIAFYSNKNHSKYFR